MCRVFHLLYITEMHKNQECHKNNNYKTSVTDIFHGNHIFTECIFTGHKMLFTLK